MNLFLDRINSELNALIENSVDTETGELLLDEAQLEQLSLEREKVIEGIGYKILDWKADVEALKQAKKNIDVQLAKLAQHIERSEAVLLRNMDEGEKFTGPALKIKITKGESTVCDETFIDWAKANRPGLVRHTEKFEPDKAQIKNLLKAGDEIPGCRIEVTKGVSVKS